MAEVAAAVLARDLDPPAPKKTRKTVVGSGHWQGGRVLWVSLHAEGKVLVALNRIRQVAVEGRPATQGGWGYGMNNQAGQGSSRNEKMGPERTRNPS